MLDPTAAVPPRTPAHPTTTVHPTPPVRPPAPADSSIHPLPAIAPIPEEPAAGPSALPATRALFAAAQALLPALEAGRPLHASTIRDAMTRAFGAGDAAGGWLWKDAYEAAEAAVVLFLLRYGRAMRRRAGRGSDGPRNMLAMLAALAALEPSHTRRSEDQVRLQQFSTPPAAGLCGAQGGRRPSRRRGARTVRRHRDARRHGPLRARQPLRGRAPPQRDRGAPRRVALPPVPGGGGHAPQR